MDLAGNLRDSRAGPRFQRLIYSVIVNYNTIHKVKKFFRFFALTYSYIGIYSRVHGESRNHFRRVQCGGRAAAARDSRLPGDGRAAGGRYGRSPWAGAAFGLEAFKGAARCRSGASAAQREAYVLSNKCRWNPSIA